MSNPRGRRDGIPYSHNFPRPFRQSWSNQPPNFFPSDHSHHPGWADDCIWNRPQSSRWDNSPQNNMMAPRAGWGRQCFHGPRGQFNEPPQQFEQYQPRFPSNPFRQNSPPFGERSLIQITTSSIADDSPVSSRSSREGSRAVAHGSKSSVPGKVEYQIPPSQSKGNSFKIQDKNQKESNTAKAGNTPKTPSAISAPKTVEKQSPSTQKPSSFMPPNDDLRNMVKESLKAMSRGGTSPAQSTSSAAEPSTDSPVRRVRESRIPSGEQSQLRRPSGDEAIRRQSGEYHGSPSPSVPRTPTTSRRRVQSQSSTTSNEGNSSSVLDGLGYIQRTPGDAAPSPSHTQCEEEPVTISREQLNHYIRSMDNQQRRQLVEQPRDSISKSLLEHLVQENQTDRARQLSSLRFRVSSTDMGMSSRNESHVMLSDELVEQIKELLAQQDSEDPSDALPASRNEDDEIEIIEPPPKTPPICIDLDCDEQPLPQPSSVVATKENSGIIDETTEIRASSLDSLLAEINSSLVGGTLTEPVMEVETQQASNAGNSASLCSSLPTQPTPEPVVEERQPINLPQETLAESPQLINEPSPCEAQNSSVHSTTSVETCPFTSQDSNESGRPPVNETSVRNSISVRTDLVDSPPELHCLSTEPPATDSSIGAEEPASNSATDAGLLIESVTSLSLAKQPEIQAQTPIEERAVEVHQRPVPDAAASSTSSRLLELQLEDQADVARLTSIDQMIIDLQNERKMITERLLVRKGELFDILCSSLPNLSLPQVVGPTDAASQLTSEMTPKEPEIPKTPNKSSEPTPMPDKSSRLLDLALQLEQNGVQVAVGKSVEKPTESSSKKRKRSKTVPNDKETDSEESTSKNSAPSTSKSNKKTATPSTPTPPPDVVETAKAKKRKSSSLKTSDVSPSATTKSKSSKSQKQSSSSTGSKAADANSEVATTQKESGSKHKKQTSSSSNKATENNSESAASNAIQSKHAAPEPPLPSSPKVPKQRNAPAEPLRSPSSAKATTQEPAAKSNHTKTAEPKKSRVADSQPTKRTEPCEPLLSPRQAKVARCSEPQEAAGDLLEVTPIASDTSSSQGSSSINSRGLESHTTSVKTMCVNGPCLFTASDDGTVHVYDLVSFLLSMRILGHQDPVTFLYAVSLKKTAQQLKECSSPAEYLNSLNLITGSQDGYIRQFSLETGNVLHEIDCRNPITCAVTNKRSLKLYVGTKSGAVFTFDPLTNDVRPVRFRAAGELQCMKMVNMKSRKAIALAAAKCDIVIYDCVTEERLLSLSTGAPLNSIHSMSASSNWLFCCDSKKSVFSFDLSSDKPLLRVDSLPSIAVDCCYHNKFLFLACQDGSIRALDSHRKPGHLINLPGPHPKTLSCMKFSDSKIVCGTLAGEVFLRAIPRFASGK